MSLCFYRFPSLSSLPSLTKKPQSSACSGQIVLDERIESSTWTSTNSCTALKMASRSKKEVDPDYGGKRKRGGKKEGKDPNAPKRPLSAFFCFSNEERPKVKAKHPDYTVGQVAKELGERWKSCANKAKFEALAAKEKERYEEEMAAYKQNGSGAVAKKATTKAAESAKGASAKAVGKGAAKPGSKSKPPAKKSKVEDDDDEDDEDIDEEEEEDDEESD